MHKKNNKLIYKTLAFRKLVRGFTIVELLVAMGLFAAVIAAAGMIFNYSLEAQRTASATAEIMRTLRAITDQLDADFKGIQTNAPLVVGFSNANNLRADSIAFFALGNFETTNTYPPLNRTVRDSYARIYYGQVSEPDPADGNDAVRRTKILARKQVILTSDSTLPVLNDANDANKNSEYEIATFGEQVVNHIGNPDKYNDLWAYRPVMDSNDGNDIPIYMAKGVDNFSVMLDGDVNTATHKIDWWQANTMPVDMNDYINVQKSAGYPDLIKFTFTLYDSKGILKGGRTFEHIVYIEK